MRGLLLCGRQVQGHSQVERCGALSASTSAERELERPPDGVERGLYVA
jgi:hypothetical protein